MGRGEMGGEMRGKWHFPPISPEAISVTNGEEGNEGKTAFPPDFQNSARFPDFLSISTLQFSHILDWEKPGMRHAIWR